MPVNASAIFARVAEEQDDLVVARARNFTQKILAEAEQAGYDLALFYSVQKAHNSMGANSTQTTRQRLGREYADEKRKLARFIAGLRAKEQARSEIAEQRVVEHADRAQANNHDALDHTEEQRTCFQQAMGWLQQGLDANNKAENAGRANTACLGTLPGAQAESIALHGALMATVGEDLAATSEADDAEHVPALAAPGAPATSWRRRRHGAGCCAGRAGC